MFHFANQDLLTPRVCEAWSPTPLFLVFRENREFASWRRGCLLLVNLIGSLSFGDMEINNHSETDHLAWPCSLTSWWKGGLPKALNCSPSASCCAPHTAHVDCDTPGSLRQQRIGSMRQHESLCPGDIQRRAVICSSWSLSAFGPIQGIKMTTLRTWSWP